MSETIHSRCGQRCQHPITPAVPRNMPPKTPPSTGEALAAACSSLRPGDLLPAQQKLYDHLLATKLRWAEKSKFQGLLADGHMIGPFNVFLQTPEMSRAFNDWVDPEAAHTSLAGDVRQVIVLAVGAAWDAAYKIY